MTFTIKKFLSSVLFFAITFLILYVASIMWRVHVAELELFGASDIFPGWYKNKYVDVPVKNSYGFPTYIYFRGQEPVLVWRQKINGFQHMYGSALSAYELGGDIAKPLFCANEFVEAGIDFFQDPRGIDKYDLLDRRKDLYHNQTGRAIGLGARKKGLMGKQAEVYIQQRVLDHMYQGKGYIPHYLSPIMKNVSSEAQLGCPGLPPPVTLRQVLHLD